MDHIESIINLLGQMFEAHGQKTEAATLAFMATELEHYPIDLIQKAMRQVIIEAKGRISLGMILEAAQGFDGHPDIDEAWNIAMSLEDETNTVCATQEIISAFYDANDVLRRGDAVGARMAFKGSYGRRLKESRLNRQPAKWNLTLGSDKQKREAEVEKAITAGKLTDERASQLLPDLREPESRGSA